MIPQLKVCQFLFPSLLYPQWQQICVDEADQHQRFAKSLGFYDEADWSLGIKHA